MARVASRSRQGWSAFALSFSTPRLPGEQDGTACFWGEKGVGIVGGGTPSLCTTKALRHAHKNSMIFEQLYGQMDIGRVS